MSLDLILNVNKPAGINSFDVIRILRKQLGEFKMGYIGTLDPFASGVLPLMTGNYTKLIPFISDHSKSYDFTIELGLSTDTLDLSGKLMFEKPFDKGINIQMVRQICGESFSGAVKQIPPKISAVKIGGRRSYKLARKGIKFKMPERDVTVHRLSIESYSDGLISGSIECSSGFYIRSFARDLAEKLGTCGIVKELNRTRSGTFSIEESCKVEDIGPDMGLNLDRVLNEYINIMVVRDDIIRSLTDGVDPGVKVEKAGIYMLRNEEISKMIIAESDGMNMKIRRVIKYDCIRKKGIE